MTAKLLTIASVLGAILGWAGGASAESRHVPILLRPVQATCISSPFGPRVLPDRPLAGSYHYGVDLAAPEGTPVIATAPGTVIRIQNRGPGGLAILVQHDGFVGIYSHFSTVAPALAAGKLTVSAGEKLGVVGTTGVTTGAHLDFEMIVAGKPVDPAPYLRLPQCNGAAPKLPEPESREAAREIPGARRYYVLLPVANPLSIHR